MLRVESKRRKREEDCMKRVLAGVGTKVREELTWVVEAAGKTGSVTEGKQNR